MFQLHDMPIVGNLSAEMTTTDDVEAYPQSSLSPHLIRAMAVLTMVLSIRILSNRTNQRLPPGPMKWPILGTLPSLGLNPLQGFANLRRRYGDIVQMYFGNEPIVVLSGRAAIRRAMLHQGEVFAGRPSLYSTDIASEGKSMCFNSYSQTWKVHRRLAERAMRMSASSRTFLENCVMTEAESLTGKMSQRLGKAFDPSDILFWAVAHVKHSLCYGDSHLDEDFVAVARDNMELNDCYNYSGRLDFFPWAKRVFRNQYRKLNSICSRIITMQLRKENEHLDTYQDGVIRDAMDALIQLGIKDRRSAVLDQRTVLHTVLEFIGAGLDIVYMTMRWTILYIAAHPEVQRKIQAEIDRVVGGGRLPQASDLRLMPYTEACLCEILRRSSVVPIALPHGTLADTELDGHFIPQGTFVLVNLHSVNTDPEEWDEPDRFLPERFLSPDGKTLLRHQVDKLCSFGVGRRRCVGEKFSRQEMFLFLTTLLRDFNVEKPVGVEAYDFTPDFGLVLRPKAYQVVVTARQQRES